MSASSCSSAKGGLQCELPRGHQGYHAAEIELDEEGKVDSAVTWIDCPSCGRDMQEHYPDMQPPVFVGTTDAF